MKNIAVVNTRNRMLSENLKMTLDTRHTDLNNNIFMIGGPGSGKTYRFVKPNLMQMFGSYVITDPKGEIMRGSAGFLKHFGYQVRVLNLLNATGMKKSTRYNPFRYIMNDTDIVKLVTTFMSATKKKESQGGDQFWEDMAGLALQAIFYYVYYVGVETEGKLHHDFKGVMHLVNMLRVEEDPRTGARKDTELDRLFKKLEKKEPNHQAVLAYNKAMSGAADTVRSVIATVNSRTACLQTKEILDLLSDDEIDIKSIGVRKTAVYCIIPDNDKTYNFLVSMLYQQMIQQMYYQADFIYGGSLPIHVTFMLDEYYNVSLPDEFCAWLTTMRSRGMSAIIIVQNMAQIKERHKDVWETIPASCDTFIYLGNNEQSTHEYVSKLLDKMTIDKQTQGQTKGKQGSSSTNEDVLGRELLLPGEVRKMNRKKCLVIINGKDPVIDYKVRTNEHPLWQEFCRLSEEYKFDGRMERHGAGNSISVRRGGQMDTVMVLGKEELELLKEESRRQREEYEEEQDIARLTGEEEPEAPELPMMSMTLKELAAFVEAMEQEETGLPEGDMEYGELEYAVAGFAEESYQNPPDDLEEHPAPAVLEKYSETMQEEEEPQEERAEGNMGTGSGKQTEEKLEIAVDLVGRGFSAEQVHMLEPLFGKIAPKQILKLFRPEMSKDMMKVVLDILGY